MLTRGHGGHCAHRHRVGVVDEAMASEGPWLLTAAWTQGS